MKPLLLTRKVLLGTAILVTLGVATSVYLTATEPSTSAPSESEVITHSTDRPDETKPDSQYVWRGKATNPKNIRLASIQTEGFIQQVGVDQNEHVAVPNNIHMAGWFVGSVLPGKKGLSIIDGHVDGRREAGIFKQLEKLKENDTYDIEFGDGTTKSFIIRKVVTVKTDEAASVLFSQEPRIERQVNLITCTGIFDRDSRQYNQRVIVISELAQPS